jgi:hypothetical protein
MPNSKLFSPHLVWGLALKGFRSEEWVRAASFEMYNCKVTNLTKSSKRIRLVLKEQYILTTGIWKARNAVLHDKEVQLNHDRLTAEQIQIRHFYENLHLLSAFDQHYCDRPLHSILSSTQSVRRRWLCQGHRSRADQLNIYDSARFHSFFPLKGDMQVTSPESESILLPVVSAPVQSTAFEVSAPLQVPVPVPNKHLHHPVPVRPAPVLLVPVGLPPHCALCPGPSRHQSLGDIGCRCF